MKNKSFSPSVEQTTEGPFHSTPAIHPTAIIGPHVTIEQGVTIGAYSVITGHVTIGTGTHIYSHVSIGQPAQDVGTTQSLGTISIGANCTIREFASIHASKKTGGTTIIGNDCYIMTYVHVAHDVILEDGVILINNVNLAGHVHVGKKAMIMANAVSHQFCKIGQYVALTPYSGTRQDLPPFCMFSGQPAVFAGLNRIALKRAGLTPENIANIKHVTHLFYLEKLSLTDILGKAQQEPAWGNDPYVKHFLTFIQESERGVSKRTINSKR